MARKSGWWCEARITSPCSTARPIKKKRRASNDDFRRCSHSPLPCSSLARRQREIAAQQRAAVGNRELDRQPFIGRPHFRRQSKHHLGAKVSFQEIDCRRRVPTAAIDIDRIDRLLEAL